MNKRKSACKLISEKVYIEKYDNSLYNVKSNLYNS
jgi:hypothetical protein